MAASVGNSGKDASTSLHQHILHQIEQNILSGKWVPGYRIPSEHELALAYQCSRMTVNKVLTQLARANMVERKRKSGTVVLGAQSRSAILEIQDIGAEVAALDVPYRYDILELKKRRSLRVDMKLLGLDKPIALLDVKTLHYAGARPFCLESRLINLETLPRAAVESFSDQPPGSWMRAHVPWTSAEHRIRVGTVGADLTDLLKVPVGTPALIIERSTWLQGQSVTFARLLYPGDTHELVARFSPTTQQNSSDSLPSA